MLALQDPAIIADEVTQSGSHGSLSMICTDDVVPLLCLWLPGLVLPPGSDSLPHPLPRLLRPQWRDAVGPFFQVWLQMDCPLLRSTYEAIEGMPVFGHQPCVDKQYGGCVLCLGYYSNCIGSERSRPLHVQHRKFPP